MDASYTYEPVVIVDKTSHRIHHGARETEAASGRTRLLTDERCQKDQMGRIATMAEAEAPEDAEPDRYCGHCYPRD